MTEDPQKKTSNWNDLWNQFQNEVKRKTHTFAPIIFGSASFGTFEKKRNAFFEGVPIRILVCLLLARQHTQALQKYEIFAQFSLYLNNYFEILKWRI